MSDLERLAIPFPQQHIEAVSRGGRQVSYVSWAVVQQRLLGTVGPVEQCIVEIVRGDLDAVESSSGRSWPARTNVIVSVVVEFTYRIDGRDVVIQEVGTPEGAYMQAHDGDRLKTAVSDATKRAAARVGVGLHLWSRGTWFLPRMLDEPERRAA